MTGRAAAVPAAGQGHIVMASQTLWVGPGEQLTMRLDVTTTGPPASAELAVSIYRRVPTRSDFTETLQDRIKGAPISATSAALADLTRDATGAYFLQVPLQDPALPAERGRLRLREEGVYPVRVELREVGGGPALDRLVTHLVYAAPPTEGGHKLAFAWVVPLHAPPSIGPDGSRHLADGVADNLGTIGRSLEAHATIPVTLEPTPETMEALAASPREGDHDVLSSLIAATAHRQVVQQTYVPISLAGAVSGLEDEESAEFQRGAEVLDQLLHTRPDTRSWVADTGLDAASLQRLRSRAVDRLVVPEAMLGPSRQSVSIAQPFEIDTHQLRRPAALAADTGLAAHFTAGEDQVLAAHQLLADLATLYFDRPGKQRGVVAVTPRGFRFTDQFLATVFDGLATSPIVEGSTIDGLFATIPPLTTGPGATLIRPLVGGDVTAAGSAVPAVDLQRARRRLDAFASMLDPTNPLPGRLDETLLASASIDLRARQRAAYLSGVTGAVSRELKLVRIPTAGTVTLTAREGEIPVTITSLADYRVRVQVEVESDKVDFPGSSSRGRATRLVELSRRNTTERFKVKARTSGAFPMAIRLTSPEGGLTVVQSRLIVRSTAASAVGIGLSVSAGLFLVVWWARHLVRGRRNRRLVPL